MGITASLQEGMAKSMAKQQAAMREMQVEMGMK